MKHVSSISVDPVAVPETGVAPEQRHYLYSIFGDVLDDPNVGLRFTLIPSQDGTGQ
jgi:hypothetical protein